MNWKHPEARGVLARVFDHGPMRQAADKKAAELNGYFKGAPVEGKERTIADHLHFVAETFVQAPPDFIVDDMRVLAEMILDERQR